MRGLVSIADEARSNALGSLPDVRQFESHLTGEEADRIV